MLIVRRVLAALLIALFGWPLIAPLLASSPDSRLPACCQRLGKHRCAMVSAASTGDKPAFQKSRCLAFPGTNLAPATRNAATLAAPERLAVAVVVTGVRNALTTAPRNTVVYAACPKRGPPVLGLSPV